MVGGYPSAPPAWGDLTTRYNDPNDLQATNDGFAGGELEPPWDPELRVVDAPSGLDFDSFSTLLYELASIYDGDADYGLTSMNCATYVNTMMAKAGIMYGLQGVLTALPKWSFLLVLYLTVALLGLFLEGTSIIVLTTPIFAPAVSTIGLDLLWYGVILVLFIEIALLTPPVGMNCYIVAEVGKSFGVSLEDVFRGIGPFLVALLVAVVLVTLLPDLALWLPSTMH